MELLGGLLVLAVMAWVGLAICAGGLCAEQPHQDVARPLPKEVRRMGFSCWDEVWLRKRLKAQRAESAIEGSVDGSVAAQPYAPRVGPVGAASAPGR